MKKTKRMDSYEYFMKHLQKLIDKYEGEYVVVVEDEIIAHGKMRKKFMIQQRQNFQKREYLLDKCQ